MMGRDADGNTLELEPLQGEAIGTWIERFADVFKQPSFQRNALITQRFFAVELLKGSRGHNEWVKMHKWLAKNIKPCSVTGNKNYVWYGHTFFFTHGHDALLFRLTWLEGVDSLAS